MSDDRKAHAATALRELADYIDEKGPELSNDVVSAVEDVIDMVVHDEAMRDWRTREAAGEKTFSSDEARKILGL